MYSLIVIRQKNSLESSYNAKGEINHCKKVGNYGLEISGFLEAYSRFLRNWRHCLSTIYLAMAQRELWWGIGGGVFLKLCQNDVRFFPLAAAHDHWKVEKQVFILHVTYVCNMYNLSDELSWVRLCLANTNILKLPKYLF